MDKTTFVCENAVAAGERLASNGGLEDLDAEHVLDNLLRGGVHLGVHQRDVVIAGNNVAQGRESFFDSLDFDSVWQRISDCLELGVAADARHQQTL